jgi:hypothetical protein
VGAKGFGGKGLGFVELGSGVKKRRLCAAFFTPKRRLFDSFLTPFRPRFGAFFSPKRPRRPVEGLIQIRL